MTKSTASVSDQPAKEDLLDFAPYARALANIAQTGDTPLTIGVYGRGGRARLR